MQKVRQINFDLVGINSTGNQRVVDTYECGVFDPLHLGEVGDVIFRGAGAPTRGTVPRGTPYVDSVGGPSDNFSPHGINTATPPKGNSTE